MELIKGENSNVNYLAKIVNVQQFHSHPDPEITKLKCVYVDGYNVIVGIDEEPGKYIYFPTSSQINPELLTYANLYRHAEKNADNTKTGYFNDNGRVTAIKLSGCVSEGFLLPILTFNNWLIDSVQIGLDDSDYENGLEFDTVKHKNKSFWVCKKYYVYTSQKRASYSGRVPKGKQYSKVIPEFFPIHYETIPIKRIPNAIQPNDLIHLSSKIHGSNVRCGWVLCKRKPSFLEKIANILTGKRWNEDILYYDYLYGSHKVVKSEESQSRYYKVEPYGPAFEVLKPALQKQMNIYAEIVGYTPTGAYIQKDYDYGCVPPENGEYVSEKNFKVRVYRITTTNVDGVVHEFSPREVQVYCEIHNLIPVEEFYYGYAKDLYNLDVETHWYENFLEKLANDKNFYMECSSPDCVNKVSQEGIVIKIDNMKSAAMKLKSWAFIDKEQKQLDAGESNIEDEN